MTNKQAIEYNYMKTIFIRLVDMNNRMMVSQKVPGISELETMMRTCETVINDAKNIIDDLDSQIQTLPTAQVTAIKSTAIPLPMPMSHGRSSPGQVGQSMQSLYQQVTQIGKNNNFSDEYDMKFDSRPKNYILDDASDDCTVTLNGHTITKKELADMIDWWKR